MLFARDSTTPRNSHFSSRQNITSDVKHDLIQKDSRTLECTESWCDVPLWSKRKRMFVVIKSKALLASENRKSYKLDEILRLCAAICHEFFLEPLRSVRTCECLSEDKNRYYTWSGLCTEGKCAFMYCLHDRVIVFNMSEFEHTSSRTSFTFSMQDSRVKRGSTTGRKTLQARLPADSGLHNSTFPSLVNCILTIPLCQSDHHGSYTSTACSRQSVCSLFHPCASLVISSPLGVRQFKKFRIACCFCFAHCFARCSLLCSLLSCFAHCCHDPFAVGSASNLSTVPGFHSVCASVLMFTITYNCLFLFLILGRYLNTKRASVQPSRPLHLHRWKPLRVKNKSVNVRATFACLPKHADPEFADYVPDRSSACHHHLVVECGIHCL